MLYAYKYKKASPPIVVKGVSLVLILTGLVLLSFAIFPLASFPFTHLSGNPGLLSPLGNSQESLIGDVLAVESRDYTDPSSWFPDSPYPDPLLPSEKNSYRLSIPALNITKAVVKPGGTNLKENLIAWPASVDPGQPGSVFIFGHSALPSFYSPANYATIFTHVYDLKHGADIIIDFDGVSYRYQVESKKIVKPDDLSILSQQFTRSRLVLITCLPPGTYALRGAVTAKLVESL